MDTNEIAQELRAVFGNGPDSNRFSNKFADLLAKISTAAVIPAIPLLPITTFLGLVNDQTSETWLFDTMIVFDSLPPMIQFRLVAMIEGNGTYFIRIGGECEGVDGTLVLTGAVSDGGGFPTISTVFTSAPIVNPLGAQVVKLTGLVPSGTSTIRCIAIFIEAIPA